MILMVVLRAYVSSRRMVPLQYEMNMYLLGRNYLALKFY